jgi:hypothetical protein
MTKKRSVITARDAAAILGRSTATVENWLKSGSCPFGDAWFNPKSRRWMYIIPVARFNSYMSGVAAIPADNYLSQDIGRIGAKGRQSW